MKDFYKWSTFDKDIKKLSAELSAKPEWTFENIYGIPRGGLVVAVCLSHQMNLPVLLEKEKITEKTLIVDDIVDTGETIAKLLLDIKDFKKMVVASLYYHPDAKFKPDVYARLKRNWVVFPFESEASSKYDRTFNNPV